MAVTKRTRTRREILQRKRPRTEEKQPNLRGITIVKDKVQGLRVRLFKWNESLLRDDFSDWGVLVTRVKNFNAAEDEGCGVAEKSAGMLDQQVGLFPLENLQRGWENEMKSLVITALKEKEAVFAKEDTVGDLAAEVVSYISSNFRFTRRSLNCSRTGRIVVFIEVDMVTTREYCVIEDDGEQEDEHSIKFDDQIDQFEGNSAEFGTEETRGEEEDDDGYNEEQYFVDFDMSEDNYVGTDTQETVEEEEVDNLTTQDMVETEDSDPFQSGEREEDGDQEDDNIEEENSHRLDHQPLDDDIDQSENNPVEESDMEEEYGYDDRLDPPFSTFHLANTYVVTDNGEIGEVEGEEDEQSFVDLDLEEIEEDEEDGSSEPELAEIEDILWRFLNDPEHVSRVDPDHSRDCRGLKQVKEAIEIIKKEICSKDKETDPCSLCLEGLVEGEEAVARTRCSHLFHRKCLRSWLSIKDSCPLCRSGCATVV